MTDRPALLDGGPLPDPGVHSLAELLPRAAATNPGPAVRFLGPDGSGAALRYAELYERAARVLTGLRRAGARPGDRVVLRHHREPELLAAFWACVLGGLLAVPVGATLSDQAVAQLQLLVAARFVLTDEQVAELRGGPASTEVTAGGWDDPALLVLTAGSSGTPKAVRLAHGNILSRSHATALANGLGTGQTTFNWMPLDHVSGLVMFHLRDVFLACDQIHAPKQWVLDEPLRWLDTVDHYRVHTTWGTNSAFDLLNQRLAAGPPRSWDLSCLRYLMNGGQAVKARTLRRFAARTARYGLPADALRPGWGMSETSAGVVDHRVETGLLSDQDRFVPVGVPHPGVAVRVVDEHDRLLPEHDFGRLQVAGPTVTDGYWGIERGSAFTADGWFRTGDMAFVADGLLTVTGSADDFILVGGRGYHGHEIETVVNELPGVVQSVACTVPQLGGELVLFCELRDADEALIRKTVADRLGPTIDRIVPCAADDIPRTGTGKPKRAQLRAWYQATGGSR